MPRTKDNLASAFEGMRADYSAAKSSRFRRKRTGVSAAGSGADYHYRTEADFLKIMELARDMDRNDSIVGHIINRAVECTIHGGLSLDPQTGNAKLDTEISQRWADWSQNPDEFDVQGQMTFNQAEELTFRSQLVDGDILGLPLKEGQLQLVEAHRLRTPYGAAKSVVHGVELSQTRRRIRYHLTIDDIDPQGVVSKTAGFTAVDAYDADGNRQVFHIYDPKRVTQTRGVSAMVPIFDCLGMFEDINFAKLVQQQIVSCFAIFRERDAGWNGPQAAPIGPTSTEARSDGSVSTIEGIAPGLMLNGAPGEKLHGFSPNVPNSEFFQHVKLILTLCSINLGLPLCLALLDASETNFSGFRGALDQAKIRWKANQNNLKTQFHTPIYRWKLRQWMAEDDNFRARMERKNVNPFGHVWNVPSWPYIEPNKDAQADITRLKGGLTSPRRLHAEKGCDSDQIARETVADNAYAIREAKREAAAINSEFQDNNPVHWRELISLPLPDGFTVSTSTGADTAPQQGGQDVVPA